MWTVHDLSSYTNTKHHTVKNTGKKSVNRVTPNFDTGSLLRRRNFWRTIAQYFLSENDGHHLLF